eukprot:scaffold1974_cov348-Pavlova_lutheri.AAC.1
MGVQSSIATHGDAPRTVHRRGFPLEHRQLPSVIHSIGLHVNLGTRHVTNLVPRLFIVFQSLPLLRLLGFP